MERGQSEENSHSFEQSYRIQSWGRVIGKCLQWGNSQVVYAATRSLPPLVLTTTFIRSNQAPIFVLARASWNKKSFQCFTFRNIEKY